MSRDRDRVGARMGPDLDRVGARMNPDLNCAGDRMGPDLDRARAGMHRGFDRAGARMSPGLDRAVRSGRDTDQGAAGPKRRPPRNGRGFRTMRSRIVCAPRKRVETVAIMTLRLRIRRPGGQAYRSEFLPPGWSA